MKRVIVTVVVAGPLTVLALPVLFLLLLAAPAAQEPVGASTLTTTGGIPVRYAAAYQQAANSSECGVDAADLAAIGWNESHHGALVGDPPLDPGGWFAWPVKRWDVADYSWTVMQIQTYNHDRYGVDGNRDGQVHIANRQQIDDVMATAANYLCQHGYADNRRTAIRAYNGSGPMAEAYADRALAKAAEYRAAPPTAPVTPTTSPSGNGRLADSELVDVGDGHRLARDAAPSWLTLQAACEAATGQRVTLIDGYRTYEDQVDIARRKGIYGQGGWAAVPGTSNHGWGHAVDADMSGPAGRWLAVNGPRFGWVADVPGENWHWTWSR